MFHKIWENYRKLLCKYAECFQQDPKQIIGLVIDLYHVKNCENEKNQWSLALFDRISFLDL